MTEPLAIHVDGEEGQAENWETAVSISLMEIYDFFTDKLFSFL